MAWIGLLFSIMPITGWVAIICGIISISCGFVALGRVRRGTATNGKTTVTALICGFITIFAGVVSTIMFFSIIDQTFGDLGDLPTTTAPLSPGLQPVQQDPPLTQLSGPLTEFTNVETLAVGTDIEPGVYSTDGPPEGLWPNCYYAIYSDSSGEVTNVVKNGNVQGHGSKGRITLKAGRYIETNGGCTWTRTG